ncbi:MAG TPA: cytochrome P450 [Candidatus Acidoferrum sp.]|nr:cytochrome P450 [Candidatus Acidoferrum sp.]
MPKKTRLDWDPREEAVIADQIAAYDRMRKECPVAYSEYLHWSLFKHAGVMQALTDTKTFSNAVSSRHVAVPNGMDPPKHSEFRRIMDPYFSATRMAQFEPVCRATVGQLFEGLGRKQDFDWVAEFAQVFAVQAQCAFLNWPAKLHKPLVKWSRKNQAAILSGDRNAIDKIALEFDGYIRERINESRNSSAATQDDPVARLLRERVWGRPLSEAEIVSILRNWTVGELSTISACTSILAHFLAMRSSLQQKLRKQPRLLPGAIDEILRIHPPLISSRRITKAAANLGGCPISQGERITIIWASANRDETVFGDPDEFRLDRNPDHNLLYGAGIHYCPGAPLARLELRIVMEELLNRTSSIKLSAARPPSNATYPAGGFSALQVSIEWNTRAANTRAD